MKRYISLGAALMMGTVLSKRHVPNEEASVTKVEKNAKKHYSNYVTKKPLSADNSSFEDYGPIVENVALPRY
jgi:hypothetical protein